MRKYAFLKDNIVVSVQELQEIEYVEQIKQYDLGIDIEDTIPLPQLGWKLEGNTLVDPNIQNLTPEQLFEIQCTKQRIFGMQLALQAVDKIGARNLKLVADGQSVDVAAIASSLQQVKMLLDGGALKTARTVLTMIAPGYPQYQDIMNSCISQISNFLTSNGY